MSKAFISVVIPAYNRAEMVEKAVRSVMKQTFRNIEICVVDDGSTDSTKDRLKSIENPRLRYACQENRGVSAARNKGIRMARGEWIAFLDSDDLWYKKKLERQMAEVLEKGPDHIYYTNERWIRNGQFLNQLKKHRKESGWQFSRFLPLCLVSMSSLLLHRSVFDRVGYFDEDLPAAEDYDFFLRVSARYRFEFLDRPLVIKHGGHSDQLTRILPVLDQYRIRSLTKTLYDRVSVGLDGEKQNQLLDVLNEKCGIVGRGCLKHGKKDPGNFYLALPGKIRKNPDIYPEIDWERYHVTT